MISKGTPEDARYDMHLLGFLDSIILYRPVCRTSSAFTLPYTFAEQVFHLPVDGAEVLLCPGCDLIPKSRGKAEHHLFLRLVLFFQAFFFRPDRLFFFFQLTLQSLEFFQPLLQLFFFLTVIFCHDDTPLTSVSLLL